jgi:hypothetical protein
MRTSQGNLDARLVRSAEPSTRSAGSEITDETVTVESTWLDQGAIEKFTAGEVNRPKRYGDFEKLVDNNDSHIEHEDA